MYKEAYGLVGTLTAPLYEGSGTLRVDQDMLDALTALLAANDWTYLVIEVENEIEIVKVIGVAIDRLYIRRSQAGSDRIAAGTGTSVKFIQTLPGLRDLVVSAALPIDILGEGAAQVTTIGNKITIHVQPLNFVGFGAVDILRVDNTFTIERHYEAAGCCGSEGINVPPPIPELFTYTPFQCYTQLSNKALFAYSFTYSPTISPGNTNLTKKVAVASVNEIDGSYQDEAVANFINTDTGGWYGAVVAMGEYLFTIVAYDYPNVISEEDSKKGLYALKPNFGSRELERAGVFKVAQYTSNVTYASVTECNGYIILGTLEREFQGAGEWYNRIYTLTYEEGVFTQIDMYQFPFNDFPDIYLSKFRDNYVAAFIINYDPNYHGRLVVLSIDTDGTINEIDSVDNLPQPNYQPEGNNLCSDGQYIYIDGTYNNDGPSIYELVGASLVERMPRTTLSYSQFVAAGDGLFMRVIDPYGTPAVEIRKWDGVTMGPAIQTISCWYAAKIVYDRDKKYLYVPNDSIQYSNGSGVFKWNEITEQFDPVTSFLSLYDYFANQSAGSGSYVNDLQPVVLSQEEPLCAKPNNVYYIYTCSIPTNQNNERTVKTAYAQLDLTTLKYRDIATASVGACNVWASGGMTAKDGVVFVTTGYDDYFSDPEDNPVMPRNAGLYAYRPDPATGTLVEVDKYLSTYKQVGQLYFISGPVELGDGRLYTLEKNAPLGANAATIKAFSWENDQLVEVGSYDLTSVPYESTPFLRYENDKILTAEGGDWVILQFVDGVMTEWARGVSNGWDDGWGHPQTYVVNGKIVSRSLGVDVYAVAPGSITFEAGYWEGSPTPTSIAGGGLIAFANNDEIIIGYDKDNFDPGIFNGFNRLIFIKYVGGEFGVMGIEYGHSPYQTISFDPANKIMFLPYPPGILDSGFIDKVGQPKYEPSGIYRWTGIGFEPVTERFNVYHSLALADVNQTSVFDIKVIPRLHT